MKLITQILNTINMNTLTLRAEVPEHEADVEIDFDDIIDELKYAYLSDSQIKDILMAVLEIPQNYKNDENYWVERLKLKLF